MKKEIKPWKCSEFVYIETAAIYKSAFFVLFSWYMAMLLVCVCVCVCVELAKIQQTNCS